MEVVGKEFVAAWCRFARHHLAVSRNGSRGGPGWWGKGTGLMTPEIAMVVSTASSCIARLFA